MRQYSRQLATEGVNNQDLSADLLAIRIPKSSWNRRHSLFTLVFHQPASVARHGDVEDGLIDRIFLPAIDYLTAKGDTRWVNALWPSQTSRGLLQDLNSEQVDQVLASLLQHPQIDYNVDDVLASIADAWPTQVVDFFGSRLKFELKSTTGDKMRFEAIPFQFLPLHEQLAKTPEYLARFIHEGDEQAVFKGFY